MSRDRIGLLVSGLLVGLTFMFMILGKERHLAEGELLLFELGPRDPRSIMQGDYMTLRYAIIDDTLRAVPYEDDRRANNKPLRVVVRVGEDRVVSFVRALGDEESPKMGPKEREILLRHKKRGYAIGAESFLFQEGERKKFEAARYGGLKRADDGALLLIGLYDKDRKAIE